MNYMCYKVAKQWKGSYVSSSFFLFFFFEKDSSIRTENDTAFSVNDLCNYVMLLEQ